MENSKKAVEAKALFHRGCNCAQAVLAAFCDRTGLTEETAMMLAAPFGGGIARTRQTCGAVTGMLMVTGLTHGYSPFTDHATHTAEKTRVYQEGQALIGLFAAHFGSSICGELLGLQAGNDHSPTPSPRTEAYYQKRSCADCVAYAAALTEAYLNEKE